MLYFWSPFRYRIIHCLIWTLLDMVNMIKERSVVVALWTSIRTSWKVRIYFKNRSMLILNLAPLYSKLVWDRAVNIFFLVMIGNLYQFQIPKNECSWICPQEQPQCGFLDFAWIYFFRLYHPVFLMYKYCLIKGIPRFSRRIDEVLKVCYRSV